MHANDDAWVWAAQNASQPLDGSVRDLDTFLDRLLHDTSDDVRVVCLGEASHGTHEFYALRAELTKRLIVHKGFRAVAAEADWPDAYRLNRWVRCRGSDGDAEEALRGFQRFPAWMWRNADVLDFAGWLRDHNEGRPAREQVGFYGLDLYSLHASMERVVAVLDELDPAAAARARARYACFDRFGEPEEYAHATSLDLAPDCAREVVDQLRELQRLRHRALLRDGVHDIDALFDSEQNARVAHNAEEYYRAMMLGDVSTWNLRDRHMATTLHALVSHLSDGADDAKVVVWAHNSHVGDARATHRGAQGELTLGQLLREHDARSTRLVGMTTYVGTVTAASDWGRPVERKRVRPAIVSSHEDIFHRTGIPMFALAMDDVRDVFDDARLERAIGVVYRPETERFSHWFDAVMAEQLDAVVHVDETRALEPLERTTAAADELPETFPSGL